ncbi:MAG: histidine phosphatase family protein [bacterium]|nr:histidine phosphatase family protein [bacterium]MCM1374280.1 histidine phosphatase family protein [Muribaculum sp.]
MKKLYFARHGQTVWNVEKRVCGATDIALTALGHEQADELGRLIVARGYEIDVILHSPLIRAAETARHIHELTGIPMRVEERLREQNFGKWETTRRDSPAFRAALAQFVNHNEGGESMMQLAQRIYNLLDELRADSQRSYLLVAHNGIARIVQSYFYDMNNEEFAAFGIDNCQVLEYEWQRQEG